MVGSPHLELSLLRPGFFEDGGNTYGNEVAPANPAAEGLVDVPSHDPVSPVSVDNAIFEERSGEEDTQQQEHFDDIGD